MSQGGDDNQEGIIRRCDTNLDDSDAKEIEVCNSSKLLEKVLWYEIEHGVLRKILKFNINWGSNYLGSYYTVVGQSFRLIYFPSIDHNLFVINNYSPVLWRFPRSGPH